MEESWTILVIDDEEWPYEISHVMNRARRTDPGDGMTRGQIIKPRVIGGASWFALRNGDKLESVVMSDLVLDISSNQSLYNSWDNVIIDDEEWPYEVSYSSNQVRRTDPGDGMTRGQIIKPCDEIEGHVHVLLRNGSKQESIDLGCLVGLASARISINNIWKIIIIDDEEWPYEFTSLTWQVRRTDPGDGETRGQFINSFQQSFQGPRCFRLNKDDKTELVDYADLANAVTSGRSYYTNYEKRKQQLLRESRPKRKNQRSPLFPDMSITKKILAAFIFGMFSLWVLIVIVLMASMFFQ